MQGPYHESSSHLPETERTGLVQGAQKTEDQPKKSGVEGFGKANGRLAGAGQVQSGEQGDHYF